MRRVSARELREFRAKYEAAERLKWPSRESGWARALAAARRIVDELRFQPRLLCDILRHVRLDEAALRAEDSGGAWCMLAFAFWVGRAPGLAESKEEALACACRGAEKDHALSWWLKGKILEAGSEIGEASATCYLKAAELGCLDAYYVAATVYLDGTWVPRSVSRAVVRLQQLFESRGDKFIGSWLETLLREHPLEATPFGEWWPDELVQKRVMPAVTYAQRSWMLCALRKGVPHGVAIVVAENVCTRSGWTEAWLEGG